MFYFGLTAIPLFKGFTGNPAKALSRKNRNNNFSVKDNECTESRTFCLRISESIRICWFDPFPDPGNLNG
jgi:hypothetical protein